MFFFLKQLYIDNFIVICYDLNVVKIITVNFGKDRTNNKEGVKL